MKADQTTNKQRHGKPNKDKAKKKNKIQTQEHTERIPKQNIKQ